MNSSRFEGCTITGTLAVSAFVRNGINIIHGPAGCAHHNVSLFHATLLQQGVLHLPNILTTDLCEHDIIFGGEEVLEETIEHVLQRKPGVIFVLSTCIADTIGDDVDAVCARDWDVPTLHLKSGGFFGGSFHEGFINALKTVSQLIEPSNHHDAGINIVGEKNLEYEVDQNFQEVKRLLDGLGLPINVRFVRNLKTEEIEAFARGSFNIVREDPGGYLSGFFEQRFGIPTISGFPIGLSGTLDFLNCLGNACGIDTTRIIDEEVSLQKSLAEDFDDLRGEVIAFDSFGFQCPDARTLREIADLVGLRVSEGGTVIPIPIGQPIGTSGVRHMLHQWRRFLHA